MLLNVDALRAVQTSGPTS